MVSSARSTSTRQAVGRTQTEPKADCEPGVGRVRAATRGFCRALSLASPPVRFSTETAALLALIGFAGSADGLEAPPHTLEAAERANHVRKRHIERARGGDGGERIGDVMPARHR